MGAVSEGKEFLEVATAIGEARHLVLSAELALSL
jgi:hypothetical protein